MTDFLERNRRELRCSQQQQPIKVVTCALSQDNGVLSYVRPVRRPLIGY